MNKKIISTVVVLAVGGGLLGYQYMADKEVKEKIDSYVSSINKAQDSNFTLSHGDYGFNLKQEIFVKDIKIYDKSRKEDVVLGDLNIKNLDTEHPIPYHAFISFEGAEYNLKQIKSYLPNKEMSGVLDNLSQGKDIVKTNFTLNYNYEPEKNNNLSIQLKEKMDKVAGFNFDINTSDLDLINLSDQRKQIITNPYFALGELAKVKIKSLSLAINDERLMEAFLQEIIIHDDKIKTMEEAEIEVEQYVRSFQKRRHSLNENFYEEFIKYIKDKKGLSLSINPEGDFTAFELFQQVSLELSKNPKSELKMLGIDFKSK